MNEPVMPRAQNKQSLKAWRQQVSAAIPEPYKSILRYFFPEFIVALVLYTLVGLIDAKCIAHLKSTACYASLGIANTLTLFITKIAEGVSVGAVIMCGQYQGQKNYEMVGKAMVAALWATALVGCSIALFFYYDSELICQLLAIPDTVAVDCIPYLRVRAVGIAFMFLFSALVGFLRGVKNTRAVMYFFVLGACSFIFFDYALIFGMFGFPAWGFLGSATAFALQYIIMFCAALAYVIWKKEYKIYNINFMRSSWSLLRSIFKLSWPVTFDKSALQIERLWMVRLIAPMGSFALGSLNVIKDMEALAFVPAVAFAQVATLLASNEFGARHFDAIKKITKIIFTFASIAVALLAGLFVLNAHAIISIFDRQHAFTDFAAQAFPVTVLLLFFDLLQLILAGALRGTGNVKVVMWVRVVSAFVLFIPLSYAVSLLPCESAVMKFIMIYGSFNVVNGLTSIVYIYWFKKGRWLAK
jgi:MATE family multidrug resistance protein